MYRIFLSKGIGCSTDPGSTKSEEECKASCKLYTCKGGQCIEDSNGTYTEKGTCEEHCQNPATYNCIGGECVKADDGKGEYQTNEECFQSMS